MIMNCSDDINIHHVWLNKTVTAVFQMTVFQIQQFDFQFAGNTGVIYILRIFDSKDKPFSFASEELSIIFLKNPSFRQKKIQHLDL